MSLGRTGLGWLSMASSTTPQDLRHRSSQNVEAKVNARVDIEAQETKAVAVSLPNHDHAKDGAREDESHETPEDDTPGEGGPVGEDSILYGYRLYAVTIGLCFGALMMSLDISIIETVSP